MLSPSADMSPTPDNDDLNESATVKVDGNANFRHVSLSHEDQDNNNNGGEVSKPDLNHWTTDPDDRAGDEDDPETLELSKLRCGSLQTEEIASREKAKKEREQRRQNRCSDYPGLAFGSAMFGSDTMMKFNIIKNELHNIMKSQLKRVDGEVSALATRIKEFDKNLEKSEHFIKTATLALSEAVQYELDHRQEETEGEEEENALSLFDAQLKLLEGKLIQARHLAAQTHEGFPTAATSSPPSRATPVKIPARPPLRRPNLPAPGSASQK